MSCMDFLYASRGEIITKPEYGVLELKALQMDGKVNGAATPGSQGPVHELVAVDGNHPPAGMPFGLVPGIPGTAKALHQSGKINVSHAVSKFCDLIKPVEHGRYY